MSVEPPAIALRGVTKRYGGHLALAPTDLEIAEGEFFCLLGPSGCGKTTTLNLIGGFVAPTAGEIFIRGQRVDRLPPHKRSTNTVFQSYALFPHMTVWQNVAFGLKMARVPTEESSTRVAEALELVRLESFRERLPAQLSGGQQQRVAVARALVNRPAVLLLDEPLGALDLKMRKGLQIELAQIHREIGTTFVYVTHDQEEAMAMGTTIAVLNEGRVEQIGRPSEIYERPNSRFVANFIGESNFLEVEIAHPADGRAQLADGTSVPCPAGTAAANGGYTLMIRPESIRISPSDADAPAGFLRCRVIQTSFLGSETRIVLSCKAMPQPITAALYGPDRVRARDLNPDREVSIWWEPEDVTVLGRNHGQQEE